MCELIMIIPGCIDVAASYVQLLLFHTRPIARCLAIWLYTCAYEGREMLTCIASKLTIYVHVASYVEVKWSLWIHGLVTWRTGCLIASSGQVPTPCTLKVSVSFLVAVQANVPPSTVRVCTTLGVIVSADRHLIHSSIE